MNWLPALSFVLLNLFVSKTLAQVFPTGMREGLMANSGTALSDTTAPSYYNPSLLSLKTDSKFSMSGSSFSNINSKSENINSSALAVTPNYLSTIIAGDVLNHEFFFANEKSGSFRTTSENTVSNQNMSANLFGYSMAFKNFPFAMQFLGSYSEYSKLGFYETHNTAANTHTTGKIEGDFKKISTRIGLSTHVHLDNYTFGVNAITRGLQLYKKQRTVSTYYNFNAGTYSENTQESDGINLTNYGHRIMFGHSFRVGSHEFLTDTKFSENEDNLDSYNFHQSFGYRLIGKKFEYYCGISKKIKTNSINFVDDTSIANGFSWVSNGLRSSLGLFYNKNYVGENTTTYGVTFASEFAY